MAFSRVCASFWILSTLVLATAGAGEDWEDERTNKCKACQKMILKFDEHLITSIFDIKGNQSPSARKKYGEFESTIEDIVSTGCQATSIHLDRAIRRECHTFLEQNEESIVSEYYKWSQTLDDEGALDNEWNFNTRICSDLTKACTHEEGLMEVEDIEKLEQRVIEAAKSPQPDATTKSKFKSEPKPTGPRKPGTVRKIVSMTFAEEIVTDIDQDALVYYAFPGATRGSSAFHRAAELMWRDVAQLLGVKSIVVGQMDAQANDVPPPFGSHVTGPAIMLYPARKKYTPALLVGKSVDDIDETWVPSVADVLSFVYRRAGNEATVEHAGKAVMDADEDTLYNTYQPADEL